MKPDKINIDNYLKHFELGKVTIFASLNVPYVYDKYLTMLEYCDALKNKINELVDNINLFPQYEEEINNQILELQKLFNESLENIKGYLDELYKTEDFTNAVIGAMSETISNINHSIETLVETATNIENNLSALQNEVNRANNAADTAQKIALNSMNKQKNKLTKVIRFDSSPMQVEYDYAKDYPYFICYISENVSSDTFEIITETGTGSYSLYDGFNNDRIVDFRDYIGHYCLIYMDILNGFLQPRIFIIDPNTLISTERNQYGSKNYRFTTPTLSTKFYKVLYVEPDSEPNANVLIYSNDNLYTLPFYLGDTNTQITDLSPYYGKLALLCFGFTDETGNSNFIKFYPLEGIKDGASSVKEVILEFDGTVYKPTKEPTGLEFYEREVVFLKFLDYTGSNENEPAQIQTNPNAFQNGTILPSLESATPYTYKQVANTVIQCFYTTSNRNDYIAFDTSLADLTVLQNNVTTLNNEVDGLTSRVESVEDDIQQLMNNVLYKNESITETQFTYSLSQPLQPFCTYDIFVVYHPTEGLVTSINLGLFDSQVRSGYNANGTDAMTIHNSYSIDINNAIFQNADPNKGYFHIKLATFQDGEDLIGLCTNTEQGNVSMYQQWSYLGVLKSNDFTFISGAPISSLVVKKTC